MLYYSTNNETSVFKRNYTVTDVKKIFLAPAELSFNRAERHVYRQQYGVTRHSDKEPPRTFFVKQSSHFLQLIKIVERYLAFS